MNIRKVVDSATDDYFKNGVVGNCTVVVCQRDFWENATRDGDGVTYLYANITNVDSEDNLFSYIVAFISLEGL